MGTPWTDFSLFSVGSADFLDPRIDPLKALPSPSWHQCVCIFVTSSYLYVCARVLAFGTSTQSRFGGDGKAGGPRVPNPAPHRSPTHRGNPSGPRTRLLFGGPLASHFTSHYPPPPLPNDRIPPTPDPGGRAQPARCQNQPNFQSHPRPGGWSDASPCLQPPKGAGRCFGVVGGQRGGRKKATLRTPPPPLESRGSTTGKQIPPALCIELEVKCFNVFFGWFLFI